METQNMSMKMTEEAPGRRRLVAENSHTVDDGDFVFQTAPEFGRVDKRVDLVVEAWLELV